MTRLEWPGGYVRSHLKGSSQCCKPADLADAVIAAARLPGKLNAGQLLGTLRELSLHTVNGYGGLATEPAGRDLFRALTRLLGHLKSGESSMFGSKDLNSENKVVRLVYTHVLAFLAAARAGALAELKEGPDLVGEDSGSPPSAQAAAAPWLPDDLLVEACQVMRSPARKRLPAAPCYTFIFPSP